jgi:hypothetical protein
MIKNCPTDKLDEARRPLASLISKSEKAQQKLKRGTWQHSMLRENLKALHIASALMNEEPNVNNFTREELQESLDALASMISRSEKAGAKFSPGTSHHTLQQNRSNALRTAEALVKEELQKRNT